MARRKTKVTTKIKNAAFYTFAGFFTLAGLACVFAATAAVGHILATVH